MFNQQKTAALPAPGEIAEVERRQRLEQFKITEAMFDAFAVPVEWREKFNSAWTKALSEAPKDKRARVVLPIHSSRAGDVWLEAVERPDIAEFWLCVGDPHDADETDEDGEPLWVRVQSTVMKRDKESDDWLKKVWREFRPVKPLQAVRIIQPNALCPCKSGKKFKRCMCSEYH